MLTSANNDDSDPEQVDQILQRRFLVCKFALDTSDCLKCHLPAVPRLENRFIVTYRSRWPRTVETSEGFSNGGPITGARQKECFPWFSIIFGNYMARKSSGGQAVFACP